MLSLRHMGLQSPQSCLCCLRVTSSTTWPPVRALGQVMDPTFTVCEALNNSYSGHTAVQIKWSPARKVQDSIRLSIVFRAEPRI